MSHEIETIKKDIFSDFCISAVLPLDLDVLEGECYHLREHGGESSRSNRLGWQSDVLTKGPENLLNLKGMVNEFAVKALEEIGLTVKVYDSNYWININRSLSYNLIHHHGRMDLIAVVYIRAPEGCGRFVASRNDGSCYTSTYHKAHHQKYGNSYYHTPKEGEIILLPGHVWHHVEPSETDDDRISISYNVMLHKSPINIIPQS